MASEEQIRADLARMLSAGPTDFDLPDSNAPPRFIMPPVQPEPQVGESDRDALVRALVPGLRLGEWRITPKRWKNPGGAPFHGLMFEREF
jgi:hypothetical protein